MLVVASAVTDCFPSFEGLTGGPDGASSSGMRSGPQDAGVELTDVYGGSGDGSPEGGADTIVADTNADDEEAGDSAADTLRPCLHMKIDRAGWTARASVNDVGAYVAIDGDPKTRWTTMSAQQTGDWFEVDFGARTEFCEIVLDSGAQGPIGGPDSADIRTSDDHITWSLPLAHIHGLPVTTVTFDTVQAHYVRVTLTSSVPDWWDIVELDAFR